MAAAAQRTTYLLRTIAAGSVPVLAFALSQPLKAESADTVPEIEVTPPDWRTASELGKERLHEQTPWCWGSNINGLLSEAPSEYIKKAQKLDLLKDEPLRDLALHETYAAAVTSNGDVLQWGVGFSTGDRKPKKTLKGKNIVKLALTRDKVYALSKSGSVYVFASSSNDQRKYPELAKEPWYAFWRTNPGVSVLDLRPQQGSERFVDIAVGESHLLAQSSGGKVYSHPVDLAANFNGQLGLRNVNTSLGPQTLHPSGFEPDAVTTARVAPKAGLAHSEYYPKSWVDGAPTPAAEEEALPVAGPSQRVKSEQEMDILFCKELYPIPSLKQIKISQIAAGGKHSIVKTAEGRVLGFGSNSYGQLGLGSAMAFSIIPTPSEIPLFKQQASCLSIAAGGDLTYLTVAKEGGKAVELLACGHGQFGGIGNGQWSHQGTPVRVKTLSGLIEWNEVQNANVPIGIYNLSVGQNHAIATLDNGHSLQFGRDVFCFGHNASWQLGIGKRSNQAVPQHLPKLERSTEAQLRAPTESQQFAQIQSRMPHHRLQLQPAIRHRGHLVEETAVAGWDSSAVYWRIVS